MTNGQNNPNAIPDDDWAMSEPEVPIEKVPQAKPIDESAAKLYAPPDTGDLEGWDINTQELVPPPEPEPPPVKPAPQNFSEPAAFTPPEPSFEIVKPIVSAASRSDDWGMNDPPKNDGWKMPEPVFRVTSGEILTKVRRSTGTKPASMPEPVNENIAEIYSPPDTEDFVNDSEDYELAEITEEIDLAESAEFETGEGSIEPAPKVQSSKNKISFLIWGAMLAGLLFIFLIVGVFVVFYYTSRH